MKIILEFKTKYEHDKYCLDFVKSLEKEDVRVDFSKFEGQRVPDYTRRQRWSEIDLQFIKEHYMYKKIPWIAKQLRRKPHAVYQKLNKMYEQGLPHKKPKNGEVEEQ